MKSRGHWQTMFPGFLYLALWNDACGGRGWERRYRTVFLQQNMPIRAGMVQIHLIIENVSILLLN